MSLRGYGKIKILPWNVTKMEYYWVLPRLLNSKMVQLSWILYRWSSTQISIKLYNRSHGVEQALQVRWNPIAWVDVIQWTCSLHKERGKFIYEASIIFNKWTSSRQSKSISLIRWPRTAKGQHAASVISSENWHIKHLDIQSNTWTNKPNKLEI